MKTFATSVAATLFPAALPLFLVALSGLGFFGWRRKRRRALAGCASDQRG